LDELPLAVTVTDVNGTVIYLNQRATTNFGAETLGANIFECHPEPSKSLVKKMYAEEIVNTYTITTKSGKQQLIHQTPWYHQKQFAGFIEFAIDLPDPLPHKDRS